MAADSGHAERGATEIRGNEQAQPVLASELVGRTVRREFAITAELVDAFADVSGDRSPIHMSEAEAEQRGFDTRVAHGVLLAALTSSIVGMDLPGPNSVLHRVEFSFHRPSYVGDRIAIELTASDAHDSMRVLVCRVRATNQHGDMVARGKVQCGLA